MPMNRVQFQPGLLMPGSYQQCGTEAQCEAALQRTRWPQGVHCPHLWPYRSLRPQVLPGQRLSAADLADRGHPVSGQ